MQSNQGPTSDQPPRHWRGTAGNRHEHHNVWVIGGRPQSYRPEKAVTTFNSANSPTDTSNMDARRDSAASAASDTSASANTGERRPSASSPGGLFYNLNNQKRNSVDPTMAARRASWTEQGQKGGFLSQWWNGYTRGH